MPTYPEVPPEAVGVYLDANVLIDFSNAIHGWTPPALLTKSDAQRIAAARLFFYGYRPRNNWQLLISTEGRKELTARGTPEDWTFSRFPDVDAGNDRSGQVADADARRFIEGGVTPADARHLASAHARGWICLFVTNDRKLIRRASRLSLRSDLEVVDSLRAEELLDIDPGEEPPIELPPGSSFAQTPRWWIP